ITRPGPYKIKTLYPLDGLQISPAGNAIHWQQGDLLHLDMDGTSALVLSIEPATQDDTATRLFNVTGKTKLTGTTLYLDDVTGEPGSEVNWKVALPQSKSLSNVIINGKGTSFVQQGKIVSGDVTFAGRSFRTMQQVGKFDPLFAGGKYENSFSIPAWVFKQLKQRKNAWPIKWTKADFETTWLAPERLLLYIQVAEPEDSMQVSMRMNGKTVELVKAYSSVRPNRRSFVGWYFDISKLAPEVVNSVELSLPVLRPGQFQGIFFENVEKEYITGIADKKNK
ncbi:MAG: hypothetical protein WKF89_19775, partial [Chitinophagaceae bacterium]